MIHSWLPPRFTGTEGGKLRLFCFPYAGGSSTIFRRWPDILPANIEVYPVELPGRGHRFHEAPYTCMQDLLCELGPDLLLLLDRPYALFGHSMGALIAFELVRWLRSQNALPPSLLIPSGRHAPQIPHSSPHLHRCSDHELIEHLRRYNGTPPAILNDVEIISLLLPTIRADFQLLETYEYYEQPPLTCAMTVFGGVCDRLVSSTDIKAWQVQTVGKCKIEFMSGDHFFIHTVEQQLLDCCLTDLQKFVI